MEMGHVFILSLVFVTIVWTLTEAEAACGKGGRRYCSDEKPCPENFACLQGQHGQQKYCRYCPCALQSQCSTFTNHTVYCDCSDSHLTGPHCNCPPAPSCGGQCTNQSQCNTLSNQTEYCNCSESPLNGSNCNCPPVLSSTCPKYFALNTELCSCFYISNSKVEFVQAFEDCDDNDGHLVKISDAQKNKVIQSLISEDSWIGSIYYSRQYFWYWDADTSRIEYENWYPGSPSDAEVKGCAIIQTLDGKWVNKDCKTEYPYICEIIR